MVKACEGFPVSKTISLPDDSYTGSTNPNISSNVSTCPVWLAKLDKSDGDCLGWRSDTKMFWGQWLQVNFGFDIIAYQIIIQVCNL